MGRLVLLRHDAPDGGHHYDLLLERQPGDHRVLTFRLDRIISPKDPGSANAQRLDEHRAAYLTYEGPISGNRGIVTREWSVEAQLAEESSTRVFIEVEGGIQIVFEQSNTRWHVEVQPDKSQQPTTMTPKNTNESTGGQRA